MSAQQFDQRPVDMTEHVASTQLPGTPRMAPARPAGPAALPQDARLPLRLRLWHRLLTPGWWHTTDAARLRGWARVVAWRGATTRAERRALAVRALRLPLDAWREAGRSVAEFGAQVEAVSGVAPATQRRQLWWLAVRHGLAPSSYLDYELYRPERQRLAAAYLQEREFYRLGRWLGRASVRTDGYPTRNKLAFAAWCEAHGLAAVPTYLEYENGVLVVSTLDGDPVTALPRRDLFSKPSDATGGHGTARWRYDDGARGWVGSDGRVRSAEALLAELAHVSQTLPPANGHTSRRILVQPCLRNHRDLLPLTPGGLCTARVLTYRPLGGQPGVVFAAYKMPTGDSPADNFHFGGVVAPVDVATGRLGPGIRRQGRVLVPVERHPDTGATLAGHQLPYWAETLSVAQRGLTAAYDRHSLGWDIAITDDGPVLVEGNTMSNPDIAQSPSGVPLSQTPFPAAFEAHLRARLGASPPA